MMYNIEDRDLPRILINGRPMKADIYYGVPMNDLPEKVISIRHKGIMETSSRLLSKNVDLQLKVPCSLQITGQWHWRNSFLSIPVISR